jgi:organic radical activating enzyme
MKNGERPAGCQYCWNIEDAPGPGPHISDRHYRSSEEWTEGAWEEVINNPHDHNINPRYVEVNFNQACNFKCAYCSPHLSTAWEKENKEFGMFKMPGGGTFHDIESLRERGLMPLPGKNADNPYVKAFWEWWPDMYKTLKVFRMTGGEPLMDKNTFDVLEYVNENPNYGLELSLTSNMCPPDQKLFDKFITAIKKLETIRIWEDKTGKVNPGTNNSWFIGQANKNFTLFISVDTVGKQAEYIRNGLNYETLLNNTKTFLRETDNTVISFINTVNILSIPKFKDFLKLILDLRIEFGYENQEVKLKPVPPDSSGYQHPPIAVYDRRQRIWFDIPYLRLPDWLSIQNAAFYPELIEHMEDCLKFMEDNIEKSDYHTTYHGFKEYEIEKHKRNIAWMKQGKDHLTSDDIAGRRLSFLAYFNEADRRRGTNFIETFPEMTNWWNDCKRDTDNYNASVENKK